MDVSDANGRGAPLRRHRTATAVTAGAPAISPTSSPAPWTPVVPAPFAGTPRQLAAANYAAFKPTAEKLASQIAPALVPFTPPGSELSTKARWFSDSADQLLVVVVGNHDKTDVSDEILAYALAWQCDRDLALVLPQTHVGLTLERLPWIETPVRVFIYSDDLVPRPMVVPSRTEILALAKSRPLRSTEAHDLKGRDVLVEQLVRRLENHWALVGAHRPGYLAWHCLGRQVIKITTTVKNVTILAGVAYGDPPAGETEALVVSVDKQLLPLELAAIERRVSDAIWKRYARHDRGHAEHRMQAALASTGLSKLDIQPGHLNREYPAWRGDGRPGFIDFLALDGKNVLHVIETKVGTADVKGALQTLDYATWVTAHASEIRVERGWGPAASRPGRETVMMDFILAPKASGGAAVGPYLAAQLEALSGGIPWRIWLVADPLADVPDPHVFERRTMPPPGPLVAKAVQGPRWAARVGDGLGGDRS